MAHDKVIQEQFCKQAQGFSSDQLTLNKEHYLHWIMSSLDLHEEMNVLDVAAGTGILSRAMAPFVQQVTSVDISDDMIQEGIRHNRLKELSNIHFVSGNAEHLPFSDNQFDLVISRFAFHHFPNPSLVIQAMDRVCKPGAQICVVDMISSEDDKLYESYNHYERLRDPSHTFCLTRSHFHQLFSQHKLDVTGADTITVDINVNGWLELTKTNQETCDLIKDALMADIHSNTNTTGMFPFIDARGLMFKQTWVNMIGIKGQKS